MASQPEEVGKETIAEPAASAVPELMKENNGVTTAAEASSKAEPALPPLTPSDFREYNRLAEQMDHFHNHFRNNWNMLHSTATTGRRPAGMTLKQLIDAGLSFVRMLTMHHDIEETYLYPLLAVKMPQFKHAPKDGKKLTREASELIRQHRQIHEGMDHFEEYLRKCRNREVDLEMAVLREKMDSWGEVLWTHMDQEVRTLKADNMRKYWTLEEMRRLGM